MAAGASTQRAAALREQRPSLAVGCLVPGGPQKNENVAMKGIDDCGRVSGAAAAAAAAAAAMAVSVEPSCTMLCMSLKVDRG